MTATYLRKRVLTCVCVQNMFAYIANVLVDAIYVYSYSLGMNFQQYRLEVNKVDDCKCFAHDKKTKCLRDKKTKCLRDNPFCAKRCRNYRDVFVERSSTLLAI